MEGALLRLFYWWLQCIKAFSSDDLIKLTYLWNLFREAIWIIVILIAAIWLNIIWIAAI